MKWKHGLRTSPGGFGLLELLVTVSLLGIVQLAFVRYFGFALRGQVNIQKIAEVNAIDTNVRALLTNQNTCLAAVQTLDLIPPADPSHPDAQKITIFDSTLQPLYAEGHYEAPGLQIAELEAAAGVVDRGVQLIEIHMLIKKMERNEGGSRRPAMGKQEYPFTYFVNAIVDVDPTTAVVTAKSCVLTDGRSKLTLEGFDAVTLASSKSSDPTIIKKALLFGPGSMSDKPIDGTWDFYRFLDSPPLKCELGEGSNLCPENEGPGLNVFAKGNLLIFSFETKISVGLRQGSNPLSFGALQGVRIYLDGVRIHQTVVSQSQYMDKMGFHSVSLTMPQVAIKVTAGKTYEFRTVLGANVANPMNTDPLAPQGFFLSAQPTQGTIFQYTDTREAPGVKTASASKP